MTTTETEPTLPPVRDRVIREWLFQAACFSACILVLALMAGLVAVLLVKAWPVLSNAGLFQVFTSERWVPNPVSGPPVFGSLAFIYGTVMTSAIAMLIAVPFGVLTAAFLSEIASGTLRKVGAFLIELLAAIPSVVYGFWGLFFLAPLMHQVFRALGLTSNGGNGVVTAGLILAVMIVPYITAISYDVCRAVPSTQRQGSLALGATRWQTISRVVLPYARPGIIAACFLALGRALGETMAVTMLIGNKEVIQLTFSGVGDSIASRIANQLNEADSDLFRAALVNLAFLLLVTTALFNITARWLITRMNAPKKAVKRTGTPDMDSALDLPTLRLEETVREPMPNSPGPARVDRRMTLLLYGCFGLTVVPLFLILGYITWRGASSLDWAFFTERAMPPGRHGGLGNALVGSAQMVGIASALAIPFGLLTAVYLSENRRSRFAKVVRFVAELLGGVPSIVIGIFAYAVLVQPFGGFSGWAGAFALGIIMIPTVVRSAEESMKLVPDSLRQASYALGATRMQTVLRIVLPAAAPAIVTGVFLAVSRIAGETAPLLLTARGSDYWPETPADPTAFLPGYIYQYSRAPYPDWQAQAWAAALVLLVVVMSLNIGIRFLAGTRGVAASRAD